MNTLVIGGTGPTGPFIVDGLLKRGYEVAIFHRGFHEVDLPSEVEHIHGDPHFIESLEQTLGQRQFDLVVCTYGRLRLVVQVMKGRTKRFIAAGGRGYKIRVEAGDTLAGSPPTIPEESPLVLDPDYYKFYYLIAISEMEVLKAHEEGHWIGTYLRYPGIYGPRELAPQSWSIIRRILDGRRTIIIPDNGLKLPARGYVENVAHAVMLTVDKPDISGGKSYNVADERIMSLREWIATIAKVMEWEGELVNMPHSVARPSYPYCTPRYYHEASDITRIINELGYRDVVPAEEAIRREVQWYLENRPEPGGELERQLADPFDYENEDRLITEFKKAEVKLLKLPFAGWEKRHVYPHPKKIGEVRERTTYTLR